MTLSLKSLLTDNSELRRLTEGARQIQTLQLHYQHIAPLYILNASRILQLNHQTLIIVADNGAVAAKLRQLAPEFIGLFRESGCEVTGIQVRVQVRYTSAKPTPAKRILSTNTQRQLTDLAEKLADSPLKLALSRLARRKD